MIDAAAKYKHAVVIGAGLLGLEAANGLALRGMDVTVVHLMPTGSWNASSTAPRPRCCRQSLEAQGPEVPADEADRRALVKGESGPRLCAVKFKDGESIPADLVCHGRRHPPERAGREGRHPLQPRHRGERHPADLRSAHLCRRRMRQPPRHRLRPGGAAVRAGQGVRQPPGHVWHWPLPGVGHETKLKVTGIDVFSAGDFSGAEGTEDIVLHDPAGGVYKRSCSRRQAGRCRALRRHGKDGAWYFQLLKDAQDMGEIRDHLMFGNAHLGDVGHKGNSMAASMPDSAEVCGCNGVCKGTIVKAIQEKGLFTLEDVRKHTKASSSCGSCTGLVEQILASTVGGAYQPPTPTTSRCAAAPTTPTAKCARRSAASTCCPWPRPMKLPGMEDAQRLRHLPAGAQLLPDLHLAPRGQGRSAVALHQRARPRQHPEGRHLLGGAAHVGRPDQPHRTARHRRRRREIQGADREGDRRPAHRPARHQEGRPARVWSDLAPPAWFPATPTARASAP
jgi:bacterioferritin-associated ferredoxin